MPSAFPYTTNMIDFAGCQICFVYAATDLHFSQPITDSQSWASVTTIRVLLNNCKYVYNTVVNIEQHIIIKTTYIRGRAQCNKFRRIMV